jgi:hypothetical protein
MLFAQVVVFLAEKPGAPPACPPEYPPFMRRYPPWSVPRGPRRGAVEPPINGVEQTVNIEGEAWGRGRPSPSRPGLGSSTLPPATLKVKASLEGRCASVAGRRGQPPNSCRHQELTGPPPSPARGKSKISDQNLASSPQSLALAGAYFAPLRSFAPGEPPGLAPPNTPRLGRTREGGMGAPQGPSVAPWRASAVAAWVT